MPGAGSRGFHRYRSLFASVDPHRVRWRFVARIPYRSLAARPVPSEPAASSIRRACGPAASLGPAASGGSAASSRRSSAAISYRSGCHRCEAFSAPVSSRWSPRQRPLCLRCQRRSTARSAPNFSSERPDGATLRASSAGFRSPRLPHHRPSSPIHAPWLSRPNLSKMACEPTESGEGRISAQSLADARPRTGNGRPRRTT